MRRGSYHRPRPARKTGSPFDRPGKLLRGIRALFAPRCRTLYLAHYLMDVSTPQSRAAFLAKVERKLAAFAGPAVKTRD